LARQSDSLRQVRQFIVFLGDNVYPRGIPAPAAPSREDAERKLRALVDAIRQGEGGGILIPGNHDWDRQGSDGWNAVRRQDSLVTEWGEGQARLVPHQGCPGPEVLDLGGHLRLVVLDSEWWLHGHEKPEGPTSACATRNAREVTDSLAGALRDRGGRQALVLIHHPLRSGGEHGGAFTVVDHIFPLRAVAKWLWLPLPVIGSLYPIARQSGISNQDISGAKYGAMRRALEDVFASYPPLAIVSGHDHSLQVIRGGPDVTHAGYQLVSGAGITGHEGIVHAIRGTLFRRGSPGFMRLDVTRDGRIRLAVIAVTRGQGTDGASNQSAFSLWLTTAPAP
jgi:hypothetical protein